MEKTVDFRQLLVVFLTKFRWIALITAVVMALAVGYNYFILKDTFTSSCTIYVLKNELKDSENTDTLTTNDLNLGSWLIEDYKTLIVSRSMLETTAEALGLENLDMADIKVSDVKDSRFLTISVTTHHAYLSANIANELAARFAVKVVEVMSVDNVSIIDEARVADEPSGPARLKNVAIASFAAFVFASALFMVIDILNSKIRTAQDIEEQLHLSVLTQLGLIDEEKIDIWSDFNG